MSRGMRAVLVEQDDIASGTSSRSSRLIHGGLRYLEQFRFGLVREALAERSRLLATRPAPRPTRAAPLPDLRHPVRIEGVLRRRADALRRPWRAARRRLAPSAVASRARSTSRRPSAIAACVAACSITTASRMTLVTRWRSHGRRRRRGAVVLTRVRATGIRVGGGRALDRAVQVEDRSPARPSRSRPARGRCDGVWAAEPDHPFKGDRSGSCRAAAPTSSSRAIASRTRPG